MGSPANIKAARSPGRTGARESDIVVEVKVVVVVELDTLIPSSRHVLHLEPCVDLWGLGLTSGRWGDSVLQQHIIALVLIDVGVHPAVDSDRGVIVDRNKRLMVDRGKRLIVGAQTVHQQQVLVEIHLAQISQDTRAIAVGR